jgi:hypothetical protein
MPRFIPKLTDGEEPLNTPCYEWIDWCLLRIRAALADGEEPPAFRRADPWSWILLSSTINRRPELRRKVRVDSLQKRVEWEPPDGADAA